MTPETKHTPGPWEASGESIVLDDSHPDAPLCIAVIEDDGGYEAPREQQRANALLIAAAPDLLAACKEAWDYINDTAPHDGSAIALLNRLVAAINAAEGNRE